MIVFIGRRCGRCSSAAWRRAVAAAGPAAARRRGDCSGFACVFGDVLRRRARAAGGRAATTGRSPGVRRRRLFGRLLRDRGCAHRRLSVASARSAARKSLPSPSTVPIGKPGRQKAAVARRHDLLAGLEHDALAATFRDAGSGRVVAGHDRLDVARLDGDGNAAVQIGEQDDPGGVLARPDRCARSCRAHRPPLRRA